jgi:hypothetical protein
VAEADNLAAICEPIVYKMREPRCLATLWASTACYKDSFTFKFYLAANLIQNKIHEHSTTVLSFPVSKLVRVIQRLTVYIGTQTGSCPTVVKVFQWVANLH